MNGNGARLQEGRAWLLQEVARCRGALLALLGRLRGEVAQTVARTVGEAAREAVRRWTGEAGGEPRPRDFGAQPYAVGRSAWDDDWNEDKRHEVWEDEDEAYVPRTVKAEPKASPRVVPVSRWSTALTAGLRTAAWWWSRPRPVWAGAVAALAVVVGVAWAGPAVAASAAGVCLSVFGVVDALAAAQAALAG